MKWKSGELEGIANEILADENYTGDDETSLSRQDIYEDIQNQADEEAAESFTYELNSTIKYKQWPTVEEANVNIEFETLYTKDPYSYEQETTVIENEGKKFRDIITNPKYYESRQAILNRTEWFWEYIRATEDTAKIEDVIRLMFNKAFNTNNFGTFSEKNIEDLFKAFEPKLKKPTSNSGLELLKKYIRSFENGAVQSYINGESSYTKYISKYISQDKTQYYIRDDGAGHPTVGFGIDIFNSGFKDEFLAEGYTVEQLKDTSGKVSVPVEFVDSLEERVLQNNVNYITNQTSSLNLEKYQIYALVSRAYNCGLGGALDGYTGINFVQAYQQYYNEETDSLKGQNHGDFKNNLYTEFMSSPTISNGEVLQGLIRRRESEWTLFQTGYFDTLDEWCTNKSIIECAKTIHEYMEQNDYTYCVYFCNGGEECENASLCGLNTTFEESKTGHKKTCCATYVSWVLQEAEYFTTSDHTNGAHAMRNKLIEKRWQEIDSIEEAEPGDILYYSRGHVEIYAGDLTVYNAGSGGVIRGASPHKIGLEKPDMIFRAP